MKRTSGLFFCTLGFLVALSAAVRSQEPIQFKLGTAAGKFGDQVGVPLTMDSTQNVQGLQAIIEWEAGKLEGLNIEPGPALLNPPLDDTTPGADVIVRRVGANFALLGVVMDNNGDGPEVIPVGNDIPVATFRFGIQLNLPEGSAPETVALTYADGKYSADAGGVGPKLDNIVVVGGLSLGDCQTSTGGDCIVLSPGSVEVRPTPPAEYVVQDTSGIWGSVVGVPVVMTANKDVQGFVVALTVEQKARAATLVDIVPGGGIDAPEFENYDAFPAVNGGALSVIMEYDGNVPFLVIPAGTSEIAVANVSSEPIVTREECDLVETYAVNFDDTLQIDPSRTRENLVVVDGSGLPPDLVNGELTLRADQTRPPCRAVLELEITYAVGSCETVMDDELGVLVPGPITVARGPVDDPAQFQVGLYYRSPPGDLDTNDPDMPQTNDHIQGVSMALKYDQDCITCEGTFDLAGTITEAVGAEFVNVICENNVTDDPVAPDGNCPPDGDGGELIVGILVDALPPFDGSDLPPTDDFLKLVCVDFHVNPGDAWNCDECQNTVLHFPKPFVTPDPYDGGDDGVDVLDEFCAQTPLIRNLASVRTRVEDPQNPGEYITQQQSFKPTLVDNTVKMLGDAIFIRGDCNWSDMGSDDPHKQASVDISDAAAVVSFLFYDGTWQWMPPCMDACDANDDGRVDLADTVFILRYLFMFGKQPPAPFPNFGFDPTKDRLDCQGGVTCGDGVPWTPDP